MTISISTKWELQQPEASAGLLVLTNVPNLAEHPGLNKAKEDLEEELRAKYREMDRKSLRAEPTMAAYDAFYRPFRKTYHVQLQLESVVFKDKPIFSPSALVTCMFMAELKTGLLTAAHDFTKLEKPLLADVANGGESYQKLDGSKQELKPGDLFIRDQQGILSSVIYGPDQRTQIKMDTTQAAFTTYAPPGIQPGQVQEQLEILENYVRLFAPGLVRDLLVVIP
jgi:DNA/RNA-binding domain of Phe-tRNA-synthetase-like protein